MAVSCATGFLLVLTEMADRNPNFLGIAVVSAYSGILATICSGFDNLNPLSCTVLLFANAVAFIVGAFAGWFLLF